MTDLQHPRPQAPRPPRRSDPPVTHLVYGQMVQGNFPRTDGHWYTFDARAGDVVSILLAPFPRPTIDPAGYREALDRQSDNSPVDPELRLYPPSGPEPLVRGENIGSIDARPLDDHLCHTMTQDGRHRIFVRERGGRDFGYRLRLNQLGGPHMWRPSRSGNGVTVLGHEIARSLQHLDAPVAGREALTMRNAVGPVLHGAGIFFGLAELVANARYEVGIRSGNVTRSDPLRQIAAGALRLQQRIERDLIRHERGLGERPFHPVVIRIIPDLLVPAYLWPLQFLGLIRAMKRKKALEILEAFETVDPRYVRIEVAVHQHIGPGEDHSKIAYVDGRYVHIGGANLQANNNFNREERDTAYLYKGEVAQLALRAFDHSWFRETNFLAVRRADANGHMAIDLRSCRRGTIDRIPGGMHGHESAVTNPDWSALGLPDPEGVPVFYLDKFKRPAFWSNSIDHPIAQALLVAMRMATRQLHMTAPNFNDEPVIDAVIYALARGVNVKLLLPYKRNLRKVRLPFGGGSNETALRRLRRRLAVVQGSVAAGRTHELPALLEIPVDPAQVKPLHAWGQLEFRWWVYNGRKLADVPGAYHIKVATIDGECVYNGSTNWDGQSLNRARETSLLTLDPAYAAYVDEYVFAREWDRRKERRDGRDGEAPVPSTGDRHG